MKGRLIENNNGMGDFLGQEFIVPEVVSEAMQKAYAQIEVETTEKQRNGGYRKKVIGGVMGTVAAAFGIVCVVGFTNPAMAAQWPLIGHIFEHLQDEVTYSGDYAGYAEELGTGTEKSEDNIYTKTVDGVSVTLSEIYTNDLSMNIGIVIKSDKAFDETLTLADGFSEIIIPDMVLKINGKEIVGNHSLQGKLVDDYTYEGIMRIELDEPVPKQFKMELELPQIMGGKQDASLPEYPDDLIAFYNNETAKAGIPMTMGANGGYDDAMQEQYNALTEEQKEKEDRIFSELEEKYYERYPELQLAYSPYWYWSLEGTWSYALETSRTDDGTVEKEVGLTDGAGYTIQSVKKTPFELGITVERPADCYYIIEVLDRNGRFVEWGDSEETRAIQDRDCSSIYIYILDEGVFYSIKGELHSKEGDLREYLEDKAAYMQRVDFYSTQ